MATLFRERWRVRRRGINVLFPKGTPKKAVDDFERRIMLGLIDRSLVADVPTVAEYAKRFREAYPAIRKRSLSTQRKDHFTLRDHILPKFGERKLTEVTAADVLAWQVELSARLKAQSVNNVVACLSSLYRLAVLEGKAPHNPCAAVPRVPRPRIHHQWWTQDEARTYLQHAAAFDFEAFQVVLLAVTSGARPGELMGLKRDCLNFEQGHVNIRRNWCTKTRQLLEHTKGRTERKVALPRSVLVHLSDKRALGPDEFVFPRLRFERAFGHLRLKPLCVAAGVRPIRFHDLRHTFASHLVLAGKHPLEVRDALGHRKLESTEVYMHLTEEVRGGLTDDFLGALDTKSLGLTNVRSLWRTRR